jgi:hypothetical protein
MATIPGKSGAGSNVADLTGVAGNLTPELAALLGDPALDDFLKKLSKAHKAYNSSGRHDPEMGAVSQKVGGNPRKAGPRPTGNEAEPRSDGKIYRVATGQPDPGVRATSEDRRMMIPPSKGRDELTNKQMYQGRPKKQKGNALMQSLAEQELTYESTPEDPQQLRPEAQLGPGVPIPGMDERLGKDRTAEAILRMQSIPGAQRNQAAQTAMRRIEDKGQISPRNVPLGMPDYDLNMGQGGQMEGVDTVAGTEALQMQMQEAVQQFETTGQMPANANTMVPEFVRIFGKDHPLFKRMLEIRASSGQPQQ